MARGVRRRARWAALVALGLLAPSSHAEAWTEAAVRRVDARLRLDSEATAHVTLTAVVHVHGGWLEGLELAGLDPDLALDEGAPAYAVDAAGERYEPRVEVLAGGRVQLSFRRRSPRRGRVTITLAYTTSLAHRATETVDDGARIRVRWGLPGWRSGLDGVGIEVLAPPGARAGPNEERDVASGIVAAHEDLAEGTRLSWRRAHLPRTVAWTVAVDVPAEAMSEALRAPPATPPPSARGAMVAASTDPGPVWMVLAALLAALACAKMLAVHRLARRSGARARALLPLPAWIRAPLAAALAVSAALLAASELGLALVLFAATSLSASYRVARAEEVSRLGGWHPVDRRWIASARRSAWTRHLGPSALVDATTALGAVHFVAWLIVPFLLPISLEARIAAALLPLPIFVSGTRLAFPSGPADRLGALLRIAMRMRALPGDVGLCPVAHIDVRGAVQDARVRTILARRPRGLLRLDLVLGERRRGGGYEREPMLLVLTREGSAAELALAERLPDLRGTSSPGGRRVLRLAPWSLATLTDIALALADCPEAVAVPRGTATPQETVRDLPAPRAVGL